VDTVVVTGGAGFIGVNFVRYILAHSPANILVVDKLTYAGHRRSLQELLEHPRLIFLESDIADDQAMGNVFEQYQPSQIFNFAAETHVDRSIDNPKPFVDTNMVGTSVLLANAWKYYSLASPAVRAEFRFLHVSTDEVYGTLGETGKFTENSSYAPNSPYAATKAGADHLVRAYHETYGFPVLLTNCSNNFGPYQFPEKLIPLMLLNGLEGQSLPIYGDGGNIRDWLFVEDHCEGLWRVMQNGKIGEKYNIGAEEERTNLQVVETLCDCLESVCPAESNTALQRQGKRDYRSLITYVSDRPGHDRRYALDTTKIRRDLSWTPKYSFQEGIKQTVEWYVAHREWCAEVLSVTYNRQRLGMI